MAASSSLLFVREVNARCTYDGRRHKSHYKGTIRKDPFRLFSITLSSHASLQDAWSVHLVNSVKRHLSPVLSRYNVFFCRSTLTPTNGHEIPLVNKIATVLTRSFNAFPRGSLVLKLIPAVGILAFAAWGLVPLVRSCLVLFQKNDSSWKSSSTHYVLTSYVRPLILWSGAALICRVLEPVILPSVASQAVKQRLLNFVQSLSAVLAFAYCFSSLIQQTQKFFMERKDISDERDMGFGFAGKAVYTAAWVAGVSLFMELLGFSTQKWLTAGGLGTVLITLAGREIFTNFLSSVMIHASRPFVLNEWIQTKIGGYEVSGTVEHIGWWSPTVIRADDREAVHIPNHKFTVNVVRNLTQKTHWRVKTHLAISHLDVNKINNIVADMRKVLAKNPQVEQKNLHRRIFLDNIDPENQALRIMVSCFVKTSRFEEYLCVKEAILLDLLRVISHHRARLATPIRTMLKTYGEAEAERSPFSDLYTRTRAATNPPYLLIEPSKINNDEKTKVSAQPDSNLEVKEGSTLSSSKPDVKDASASTSGSNPNGKVDEIAASNTEILTAAPGESISSNSKKNIQYPSDVIGSSSGGGVTSGESSILNTSRVSQEPGRQSSPAKPPKQDSERSVSVLEDNILLGVALDGSKRTLPMDDEDISHSSITEEPSELASRRKGNGSTTLSKGNKDDQKPPRTTDQREKD